MANIKIRYLTERRDKKATRYYWQPASDLQKLGWRVERLPDDRMQAVERAEALNRQLDAWRNGDCLPATDPAAPKRVAELHQPGTVGALTAAYKADERFKRLRPKTQKEYGWALGLIEEWCEGGKVPVAVITPKRVQTFYKSMLAAGTPAKANAVLRVMHILCEYARREDMITLNPAARAGAIAIAPRVRVLSLDEIDALIAHADDLGLPSVGDAILMGQQLGQRQGDILSRTWLSYQDSSFLIRQKKTNAIVKLPAAPRLQLRLDAARKRQAELAATAVAKAEQGQQATYQPSGFIIALDGSGGRYKGATFTHLFARVRAAAAGKTADKQDEAATRHLAKVPSLLGLPSTEAHPEVLTAWYMDLRDTCVTMMGDAGCTVPEIASITGHTPESVYRVLRHYLANSAIQANNAIGKLVAHEDALRAKRGEQKREV